MEAVRGYLGKILDRLNRADALPELHPKTKGDYVYLSCPKCGKDEAYISQRGYYIYCNRQNKCSYREGLVEYIAHRDGISEEDAIRKLAKITSITLPEFSAKAQEEYKKQQEKARLCKDILDVTQLALWYKTQIADDVRQYLYQRCYQDDEIIEIGFGCITNIDAHKQHLKKKGYQEELVEEVLSGFSLNRPLIIPFYNDVGILEGFITRAISLSVSPKYLNTKGLQRGSYFFNFHACRREETLIVVEGILDALTLSVRGVEGVVACGGAPTESQIKHALQFGKVRTLVLCLDNDDAGIRETKKAIRMIQALKNQGALPQKDLRVYVAKYKHKDPDDFANIEGVEAFRNCIKQAEDGFSWVVNKIICESDVKTDIGKDKALDELEKLAEEFQDARSIEILIQTAIKELGYSRRVIADKVVPRLDKRTKQRQKEAYKTILHEARRLEKENKFEDSLTLLEDGIRRVKEIATDTIVAPYSNEKAEEDIKNRPLGLSTGYTSVDKFISIPNGAITLVCGRPSHGKTTFLLNLLLNLVDDHPKKSFFFFSYEESKTALYLKVVNIISGVIVSENQEHKNLQQLEYYIRTGSKDNEGINRAREVYDRYTHDCRLWLIDTPLAVDDLATIVENLSYQYDIGGVFIDYAQRVKYNGKYETERVKIARISETLRETATRLDIPIIVGAQLNRENAKEKPQLDNLKEAGNLEEDANIVLGLYNWKTAIDKEKANEIINKEGEVKKKVLKNCQGTEVKIGDIRDIDFEAHILKNRNGAINEAVLLKFDAPVLRIREIDRFDKYSDF